MFKIFYIFISSLLIFLNFAFAENTNIFKSKSNAFLIKGNKIDNSIFKSLKLHESIIIDDFEECHEEQILYSIFNLIDQDNKYLLINSLKPINKIKFKLPDLSSRSKNCLYAEIENPDDELLFAIILKNFSDRQIKIEKKTSTNQLKDNSNEMRDNTNQIGNNLIKNLKYEITLNQNNDYIIKADLSEIVYKDNAEIIKMCANDINKPMK